MIRFALQLVTRGDFNVPQDDVEELRQVLHTNVRRRVEVDDEMPFKAEGKPGELDPEWVAALLQSINRDGLIIESTPVRVCPCAFCMANMGQPTSKPPRERVADVDSSYHLHWKLGGHARSIGIVVLLTHRVLRDWDHPLTLSNTKTIRLAIEMVIDEALIECAKSPMTDDALKAILVSRTFNLLKDRLPHNMKIEPVQVSLQHAGNRCMLCCDVVVRGPAGTVIAKVRGGRTILSREMQ